LVAVTFGNSNKRYTAIEMEQFLIPGLISTSLGRVNQLEGGTKDWGILRGF
jgi:hypothetical protein